MKKSRSDSVYTLFVYAILILFSLACIYPILLTLSVSVSDESLLQRNGYKLIPDKLSLDTYRFIFSSGYDWMTNGYAVTISVTILGTLLAMAITTMFAYVISSREFKHRNKLAFMCYFTILFNAGLLPWYLFCVKYGLRDELAGLILPYLMNAWFVFLLRVFFSGIPHEISESAKIDGAGQWTVFLRIMLPLAIPGVVTVAMFIALNYWNDWYLALMFVSKPSLQPLQYHLYSILSNVQFLASSKASQLSVSVVVPQESAKMAVTFITIGPIILVYPFVQKLFVKGLTTGALKG